MADYQLFIDGELCDSSDGDTFATYNPATNEKIADVAKATKDDAVRAITAARKAFDEGPWSKMSGPDRAAKLREIAAKINEHSAELAELEALDGGGTIRKAMMADVPGAATEYTDALGDFGFTMEPPTNGAGNEEIIEVTRIYATSDPTSQAVALSVARVMGELPVERMPTPAPIENATEGLGAATVLVMLGKDLAGRPLPGPPGA